MYTFDFVDRGVCSSRRERHCACQMIDW